MASAPNRIGTLVIGPQAGGRGYRVLARSAGPAIAGTAEGRLSELALVLAGWADEREAPAVALIPLGDATTPALLMRFAYLGTAPLGTIAYANGLILDEAAFALCAGRPESLLPLIPPPDGSRQFAEAPLIVQDLPQPRPPRRDWNGLGLEWRDRLVLVDDLEQEEPTLTSILRSIGPAGPGARVRGWATTALLPSSGSFSPARELQLLVVEVGRRRPGGLHHLPAHATPTGFDGDRVTDLPPAAQAWERLKSVGSLDVDLSEAVGPLRWSPADLNARPADIVTPAARDALRRLSGGAAQMRFVLELARPRGDGLDAEFGAAARTLFAQLVDRPALEPQHAAFYIKTLADAPADAANAMRPLGPLLVRPGSARWLRGRTFDRLIELGYAEALAERADEAPALLDGLGSDALLTLLRHASQGGRLPPAVASAALRELADQAGTDGPPAAWRDTFSSALRWRFGLPAGADERLLASRSVVRATSMLAPALRPRLAQRALQLREAQRMTARQRLDMLAGTLEWVRFQGAAT
ncbi:MAG TPA: hypothetical protein VEZ41_02985 [Allosphingosinicella sp.]|nr:hypothetical protein [Allosphingosinicella sp.]